jgi:uncharacterized protein
MYHKVMSTQHTMAFINPYNTLNPNLNKNYHNTSYKMTNTDTNNVASKPSFDTSFNIGELSQQIEQSVAAANHPTRPIPPLEKWQPKLSGAMDMVVKANGEWWLNG